MNAALQPIAARLGKLIKMLSSDKEGEVVAARLMISTLNSAGLDIHALADSIGSKVTDADLQASYDRGRQFERAQQQRNQPK
jgi:hypothetical protein